MNHPINISFTSEELQEFGELYLKYFGEELNPKESSKRAEEYISFIYGLTNGSDLEVRSNNTALVTRSFNSLNNE